MLDISASIIQGSEVGPVSYVINTGDLETVVQSNRIHKYADDISTAHLYTGCDYKRLSRQPNSQCHIGL